MPSTKRKMRKASLATFCVVVLATVANANVRHCNAFIPTRAHVFLRTRLLNQLRLLRQWTLPRKVCFSCRGARQYPNSDRAASRAYKQAMSTLATLTALPPMQSEEPSHHSTNFPLSALLHSTQGQGPIASALRILVKLRNHSWLPAFVTDYFGRESSNGRRKDEEHRGKAVKVLDLLHHAAELGHTDALYTLGQVSLVRVHHPTLVYAISNKTSSGAVPAKLLFPDRPFPCL